LIGTNLLIMNLVKFLHPDAEINIDLRATDGGKIKIGNTRFDLWGGTLGIVRPFWRILTGTTVTAAGHVIPTKWKQEVANLVRSREAPLYSLITDAWTGQTMIGEPFGSPPKGKFGEILTNAGIPKKVQGVLKEAGNRLGPLTMQDFVDAFADEGLDMATIAGAISATGTTVQTYAPTAQTEETILLDKRAHEQFGKNWRDLNARQQRLVARANKTELTEAEQKSRAERVRMESQGASAKHAIEEGVEGGKLVLEALSKEAKEPLENLAILPILEHRVGDWSMNDKWYARYVELTAKELNRVVPRETAKENWPTMPDDKKQAKIKLVVDLAKQKARAIVMRESNRTP